MKFGIFIELQLPRPWSKDSEFDLFQNGVAQAEMADRLGFDYLWVVEHHFFEEHSHLSASDVFLAACSQRTTNIRLGHGIRIMTPNITHPARVAESVATLDLLSGGRVDFGIGAGASTIELDGFLVDSGTKKEPMLEAAEQCVQMMTKEPYPGYSGKYFSMPSRNVLPKPYQKPHPPLWMACTNRETMSTAAKLGLGALTVAFTSGHDAKHWVKDYYDQIAEECTPLGEVANPNVCMVMPLGLHADPMVANRRFAHNFDFFSYSLLHHYQKNTHQPGVTDIWEDFVAEERKNAEDKVEEQIPGIGSPQQIAEDLAAFAEAGVDQVAFIIQAGRTPHEHIIESMQLFADTVMKDFQQSKSNANKSDKTSALASLLTKLTIKQ